VEQNEKKKEMYLERIAKSKGEVKTTGPVSYEMLLKLVRDRPLFGCQFFYAKPMSAEGKESSLSKVMLAVNSQGLFIVAGKDKTIQEHFPFFKMLDWSVEQQNIFVVRVKPASGSGVGNDLSMKVHSFKTQEGDQLANLLTVMGEEVKRSMKPISAKDIAAAGRKTLTEDQAIAIAAMRLGHQ